LKENLIKFMIHCFLEIIKFATHIYDLLNSD
jgi:hypothetical protein